MIIVRNITIPQLSGDVKRRAYVYLPNEFKDDPTQRYPVLYMFDGHNVFFDSHATYGKSWGMLQFLQQQHIPLIVAAVECNHSPDHGRLKEYSPFNFSNDRFGKIKGRGKETMDWLVNEFKPWVDKTFPTLPGREFTFISGSSMGGLMTLYALCDYNQIFSRGAALSPSLWLVPRQVTAMVKKANILPDTVLYMDYGQEEFKHVGKNPKLFGNIATMLIEKGMLVNARIVPGGSHCEASWEKQIPIFMDTLFYDEN